MNELFERYSEWFELHVARYRMKAGDQVEFVERKVRHTARVVAHVQEIIPESGAEGALCETMSIAALLHDVGRFPQLVRGGSYDDAVAGNHAEAGARLLEHEGILNDLPRQMRRTILAAVGLHNVAVIPGNLDHDTRLVLEAVRDADKLDAIRNNLRYLHPEAPHGKVLKAGLAWHETEVSPLIVDLVMSRQLVNFRSIRWSNDFILFLCCWVYDLHFPYAWKQLQRSGNFERLLSCLPETSAMGEIKDQLRADLIWIAGRSQG